MRDQDYALERPDGVVRIAIVEASRAVGFGVRDEDLFEARLERRLNAEYASADRRFEVLNFSIYGHLPLQRLYLLEQRAVQFEPNVVIYIGGTRESSSWHIARMYRQGVPSPYPVVDDLIARSRLRREMSMERMTALLERHHIETLGFVYSRFVAAAREHGATPVFFYLPALDGTTPGMIEQRRLADEAGFVILNLDNVYSGRRQEELQLTPSDYLHPNAVGHRMIADALFAELVDASGRIDVWPDRPGPSRGDDRR